MQSNSPDGTLSGFFAAWARAWWSIDRRLWCPDVAERTAAFLNDAWTDTLDQLQEHEAAQAQPRTIIDRLIHQPDPPPVAAEQ